WAIRMPGRCSALASTDDGRTKTERPPPSKRLSEDERQQMEGHQPLRCVAINTALLRKSSVKTQLLL
ncbi:MAG: hypothetical protein QOG58_4371, partial [Caballeronia sp.]|nr:hypothetical protein [Caballeronia sp.]